MVLIWKEKKCAYDQMRLYKTEKKVRSWTFLREHAGVKGKDQWGRLADFSCLYLGQTEGLRGVTQYLLAQSQGHHTIDRLEEKEMMLVFYHSRIKF